MINSLLSVGIDIGTTTTHMVVCKLHACNTTGGSRVPRLEIGEREIFYESKIYFTPIKDNCIDAEAVKKIVECEYNRAGIKPSDIDCGAIIITGESANKRNAQSVIESISHMAGDFVAASAGAHLESILAAKGSGAMEHSKINQNTVCNIDIGGGTTNVATYKKGELIESWCIAIGGRFIQFDAQGNFKSISDFGKALFKSMDLEINLSEPLSDSQLSQISNSVAKSILDLVTGKDSFDSFQELLLTKVPEQDYTVDEYWFSGGVAALSESSLENKFLYGDLGVWLNEALKEKISKRKLKVSFVDSAIRATVIGAGSHTIQLSGHTVHADQSLLPLKNIPLLKAKSTDKCVADCFKGLESFFSTHKEPVAIVLPQLPLDTYEAISDCARKISKLVNEFTTTEPIILILKSDAAMALGLQLKKIDPSKNYIVLDGVDTEEGDFIEIGKPIDNGLTLPVTVKTLIFGT